MQHEGEVQPCSDQWHEQPAGRNLMTYTYADLVDRTPAEQAAALRRTHPGGTDGMMTVAQLREKLSGLPGDAVVVIPVRETREWGGFVAGLVPVWVSGREIYTQDQELDKPEGWGTDDPEPDAGLPRTGVLYGVMLDPDADAPW
jgi:hypothetical protein